MRTFRQPEQRPPEGRPITDGVVMRLDDIYEVDPNLMGTNFEQQSMPVWDTERIVDSRWEHLNWMHFHFADEVLTAGEESELHDVPCAEEPEMESRKRGDSNTSVDD
jgi:hypothetical protein